MAIDMQVVYHNVLVLEVYTPPRFGYGFFGTSVADLHNAFNFIIFVVFPLSHTQLIAIFRLRLKQFQWHKLKDFLLENHI